MKYEVVIGPWRKQLPIAKETYESITLAHNRLLSASFIEESFDIVLNNYFNFQKVLLSDAARQMIFMNMDDREFHDTAQTISVNIINLLSSARLYLDQTKHQLSGFFDSKYGLKDKFKLSCESTYDEQLGYRAMEELRNYAQHRGLPVHSLLRDSQRYEFHPGKELLLFSSTPMLDLNTLQIDKKFKRSILKELIGFGDQVDLRWLIQEYLASLGNIHFKLRESLQDILEKSEKTIKEARDKYLSKYNEKEKVVFLVASDENGHDEDHLFLNFRSVKRRKYLEAKNRKTNALLNGCVIGQHIDTKKDE